VNKIGWCSHTVNPITGCSNFGRPGICGDYCYAARLAIRQQGRNGYPKGEPFRPTFHPDKLQAIANLTGKGKRVFLNSMSDWFCEGVLPSWIAQIVAAVWEKPEHKFLVLTKRPENVLEMLHCINLPETLWFGVSVTCQADIWRIEALDNALPKKVHKFVSFEPLHGPIHIEDWHGVEWVIIGAESGRRAGRIEPEEKWVKDIFDSWPDEVSFPVFMKDNLMPYLPGWSQIRAFPEG
jgi:protein gp37